MSLELKPFTGLPLFLADYRLQQNQAAALFARSPRTVRRWIRRGSAPQNVPDLVDVIRTQRAPIAATREISPATSSSWRIRLEAPGPHIRHRRRLRDLGESCAVNHDMQDLAIDMFRKAGVPDPAALAARILARDRARRTAAQLRELLERRRSRAVHMRGYRRRRR